MFLSALKGIQEYLQNQKRRVTKTSILGPLLFNIFLCSFFREYGNNYFANYADNTKIHIVDENTKEVLTNLSALAQKQHKHGWLTFKRK